MEAMKKRMNKKGLAMRTVGIAIITLVAIAVILFVFRGQISNLVKGYTDISQAQIEAAKGEKCQVFFTERKCNEQKPGDEWEQVDKPKDGWSDCEENEQCWEK